MTVNEQREAARNFANKWLGKGKEDEEGRTYWLGLLSDVLGMGGVLDRVQFEKKVVVDGNTKRIDVYIPETHVIIEQKSLGKPLDKKLHNSGDEELTAYEQAKRYNDNLPYDEKARWIVTSNFAEIWIYDMNAKVPEPNKIRLEELQNKYPMLDVLILADAKKISREVEVSVKAGEIVGLIYDAFLEQYQIPKITKESTDEEKKKRDYKLHSLNELCVRLVFCLYAEDAGIFGKRNMFHDYLQGYSTKDCRRALIELFKVLDTKISDRDPYLEDDLAAFPYVNGGLFANEDIEIPPFTDKIKQLILENASENFDWSDISPTIFGGVFESTLNPETRRSGGMHYTSIENIHKVIDPLFLDDLKTEFEEISNIQVVTTKKTKLKAFQRKIASLKFLDPACGSGNFLTETFLSLRRLENKILAELAGGQMGFTTEEESPIQVSIQQFYGIEINDFAVTVAKTALWIAEAQMLEETKSILFVDVDFLPLKTNAYIHEGNALRMDWESIVPKSQLSYIMGNPPFVGARIMNEDQKQDVIDIFGKDWKNVGNLDYVCCWYMVATKMMVGTSIRTALVSTNSVSQGETVANLWKPLFKSGVHIDFAHRTFRWDSEAKIKAHVHCVIIGFSIATNRKPKELYNLNHLQIVKNINGYLVDANNVFIEKKNSPLCDVPELVTGCQRLDDDNFMFTDDEKEEFINKEPLSVKYFYKWYGAKEFINNKPRWCLYLGQVSPAELNKMPYVKEIVSRVKEFRLKSNRTQTKKYADYPTKFYLEVIPTSNYITVPVISSERRRYIPMGFLDTNVLCSNQLNMIPNAEMYHLGILSSNVHMAWVRAVCGRLKSDYRYSKDIVYNNFPWSTLSEEQCKKIGQTAQGILDARALYPDSSLADLYDPLTMPPELQKAHRENDKVVMKAYGFSTSMSEADCVAELMKMYQKLVTEKEK